MLDFSTAAPLCPPALTRPGHDTEPAGGSAQLALSPYQAGWPARFRVEAEVLRVALSALSPTVEHVGSTAVPSLAARPVIDILVGLPAPLLIDAFAARLSNFGYIVLPPSQDDGVRVVVRRLRGVCTHHVQVVATYGHDWHRILLFRDLLRHDEALARQYTLVKLDLMRQHQGDAVAYASGKASFIRAIVGA